MEETKGTPDLLDLMVQPGFYVENFTIVRLNAAAEALHTTDDTVMSIAEQCGFENLSYFNREFKAHFGMTPREYRR